MLGSLADPGMAPMLSPSGFAVPNSVREQLQPHVGGRVLGPR
jgi:hypothetical protein